MIKWLNCYYLENRMRNMNQTVKTLVRSCQDILTSVLCEDLIVIDKYAVCNKWMIKWLNCYYLEDRMRNMSQTVKTLVRSCQDILIPALCEDLIVTNVINETKSQRSRCVAWREHAIHSLRNLLIIHVKK